MTGNSKAHLFAAGSILLWGSTASVIKLLLVNLNSIQILFFASLFATVFLFTVSFFQGKLPLLKGFRGIDYAWFASMGLLGVFVYYVCLYLALSYLPAQEAFIINYLWPIFIVIFAVLFLKERFTITKLIATLLSFAGVAIVTSKGNLSSLDFASPLGVFLAVVGAAAYGLFSVLGKKRDYDRFLSMAFYYLATFVYCSITLLLFDSIPSISAVQLLGLMWVGIGTSGLAFTFWFLALKYGNTSKIANLAFITPFLSLVYIYFLLGEAILPSSIFGLALIALGILVQNLHFKKQQIL